MIFIKRNIIENYIFFLWNFFSKIKWLYGLIYGIVFKYESRVEEGLALGRNKKNRKK
jgi:hypothetical protein